MKPAIKILSSVTLLLIINACGNNSGSQSNDIQVEVPAQSEEVLKNYLTQNLQQQNQPVYMALEDSGAANAAPRAESDGNFSGTSRTNLQERGVDELFWVKNDDDFIFAYAPNYEEAEKHQIKIYQMNGASTELINNIEIDRNLNGLYLRSEDAPGDTQNPSRQLVAVSDQQIQNTYSVMMVSDAYYPYQNWQPETHITLYDASQPNHITTDHQIRISGNLLSSRRADNHLLLITRHYPYLEGLIPYASSDADKEKNSALLEQTNLEDLLPTITLNGATQTLVLPQNCYVPQENNEYSAGLITVTQINLDNPGEFVSLCLGANADTVYVSDENIYLANNHYPWHGITNLPVREEIKPSTSIHRLAYPKTGLAYKGNTKVSGTIGHNSAFRLSEYQNHLRVFTSEDRDALDIGSRPTQDHIHRLHTLKLDENTLTPVATLPNEQHPERIGKPGELIYSTRFDGKRAYVVTFKKVDPFYVIDLADPTNPQLLGELEMPGYSDMLQPIGDNLVLGIGKDAKGGDESFAWYQGVKIGLFNVSQPSAPTMVNEFILGKRGSHSMAEYDHRAITLLPSDNGQQWRIALPVSIHDDQPRYAWNNDTDTTWYDWRYDGLFLFDLTTNSHPNGPSLTQKGVMITSSTEQNSQWYSPWSNPAMGSVLKGDNVHFFYNDAMWSASWNTPEIINGPK